MHSACQKGVTRGSAQSCWRCFYLKHASAKPVVRYRCPRCCASVCSAYQNLVHQATSKTCTFVCVQWQMMYGRIFLWGWTLVYGTCWATVWLSTPLQASSRTRSQVSRVYPSMCTASRHNSCTFSHQISAETLQLCLWSLPSHQMLGTVHQVPISSAFADCVACEGNPVLRHDWRHCVLACR